MEEFNFNPSGVVTLAGTQTLTNKTITTPILKWPDTSPWIVTIDFGTGHADVALTDSQVKADTFNLTGTVDTTGAAIIAPVPATNTSRRYVVRNGTAQAITVKKNGGTGVAIAAGKTAIVAYIGTDYVRVTGDA